MSENIGIIGLGRMGLALATRLAGQGCTVQGWTRSGADPKKVAQYGFDVSESLENLAPWSDIMILSLFDDAAVREVLGALCDMDINGTLLVETSTVSPKIVRDLQGTIEAAGGRVIDAPISGGPEMVLAGTSGLFVGGAKSDVARLNPVLAALSDRVAHVGDLGAGLAAKIVNNVALAGAFQATIDALDLGDRMGLDLETMLGFLEDSPGTTPMFKARIPKMLGNDDEVGFSTNGALKDAGVFLQAGVDAGIELPAISRLEGHLREVAGTLGNEDVAAIIKHRFTQS